MSFVNKHLQLFRFLFATELSNEAWTIKTAFFDSRCAWIYLAPDADVNKYPIQTMLRSPKEFRHNFNNKFLSEALLEHKKICGKGYTNFRVLACKRLTNKGMCKTFGRNMQEFELTELDIIDISLIYWYLTYILRSCDDEFTEVLNMPYTLESISSILKDIAENQYLIRNTLSAIF